MPLKKSECIVVTNIIMQTRRKNRPIQRPRTNCCVMGLTELNGSFGGWMDGSMEVHNKWWVAAISCDYLVLFMLKKKYTVTHTLIGQRCGRMACLPLTI